ncbi:MAG: WYL domain-containing protein [Spirochaetales bacterium]|nr:WYL domain-containing protein [Spirochaetales bacterium]
MAQISQIDILSRTLQIIRLMARDEGATVTEISKETGIDRWTVRDMIDRMENFNPDGKGLYIEEFEDERDRRQTRYKVPKENLWTLTLPGMNLSDDEALLLALMFNQGFNSPDIQDSALNLRRKLNMFRNFKEYEVLNLSSARKISTKETQKAIVAILNAIRDGKCINFSYKPVRREVTEYRLMPLGVFRYDNGFYLAAQKLPEGEFRSFGLERVVGVPTAFDYEGELPERYNYEELFDDPFGPFGHNKEINAVLKFDSFHGFYNLERNWPDAVKIEVQPDESVIMRARTRSYSGIRKYILGFGTGVEVLEPEWLRNAIRDWHQKAADMYRTEEEKAEVAAGSDGAEKA